MYDIDREHIGDLTYLGNLLADARFSKNLSQRQVALYADISNTELYRIEKGTRQKPSPKILKKLSEILDIPYEWLLQYAGYLDLQDDTLSNSITMNYNSLSAEERDFILTYLCNKWNDESPDKSKKYTKKDVENILFEDKDEQEFRFAYHKEMEGLTDEEIADALIFYKEMKKKVKGDK